MPNYDGFNIPIPFLNNKKLNMCFNEKILNAKHFEGKIKGPSKIKLLICKDGKTVFIWSVTSHIICIFTKQGLIYYAFTVTW